MKKNIVISEKLHSFLVDKGKKKESFEDIIWRLIEPFSLEKKNPREKENG